MTTRTRRYLFAAYEDIESLDFEHLEKVCDRLFVLIADTTLNIPFTLVRRLQSLGKGVKWIPISESNSVGLPVQLAFLMGKLHQKLPSDIEFAILSDDEAFDSLVHFIHEKDRTCFRVRVNRPEEEPKIEPEPAQKATPLVSDQPKMVVTPPAPAIVTQPSRINPSLNGDDPDHGKIRYTPADAQPDEPTVRNTARDVIERLLRSGNRPAEVSLLKQYISLTNQHMMSNVVEKVVTYMALNNDIQISDKEVLYNF